jgi:hypothetical protein
MAVGQGSRFGGETDAVTNYQRKNLFHDLDLTTKLKAAGLLAFALRQRLLLESQAAHGMSSSGG